MMNPELKHLIEETHPIRPGQEARAWAKTRAQLFPEKNRVSLYAIFNSKIRMIPIGFALALFLFLFWNIIALNSLLLLGSHPAKSNDSQLIPVSYPAPAVHPTNNTNNVAPNSL